MNCYKNLALFAGGVLFGSAGIKLLSSKDAKKAYTHTTVRENAGDILAEAKELNEQCAAREEVMEDAAEESGAKV